MKKKKTVINKPISEVLKSNYMPYSMSVIMARAIPEIDGLKPAHRKLLYTMYEMGLHKKNSPKTKSANIVGQTMQLNPHGDISIYETLVRLTSGRKSLLHPLIDSKGAFGHQNSLDQYAASRYTEAKLDAISNELFNGIERDMVDFKDSYDGRKKEPVLLPVSFPNILVNPNMGVAVGMASKIPSFNMNEVIDGTIELIKNKKTDIFDFIKVPDFSTGGDVVLIKNEAREIIKTGQGSYTLKAKHKIDKKNRVIEVYEIPYEATTDAIIEEVRKAYKSGKMKEINGIRDETDKDGLKIAIDYKTTADVDLLVSKLYSMTRMEDTFSCNINVLIKGEPRTVGVKELLLEWIEWRIESVKRGFLYDINRLEKQLHLLKGLEKIILDIDKAIKTIRDTKKSSDVIMNLMNEFSIDEIQAEYIAEIKLRNINEEYISNKIKDIEKLEKEIKRMTRISKSNSLLGKEVIKELNRVKKEYGKERITTIIDEEEHKETQLPEIVDNYNLTIMYSKEGYVKKIPATSLRANININLKEGDEIIKEFELDNTSELIFLTNKCNAYKVKVDELNDNKPNDFGHYENNIIDLEDDEEVVYMHATNDFSGDFIIAYENGKIAKVPVDSYKTKTRRTKLINSLYKGSKVIGIEHIIDDEDIVIISDLTRGLVLSTSLLNPVKTRSTQGVQVLRLRKGEKALKMSNSKNAKIKNLTRYRANTIPLAGVSSRNNII